MGELCECGVQSDPVQRRGLLVAGWNGGDPRQLLVDSRCRIGSLELPLQRRERKEEEEEEEEEVRASGRIEHEIPTSIASIAAQTLDLCVCVVRTVCQIAVANGYGHTPPCGHIPVQEPIWGQSSTTVAAVRPGDAEPCEDETDQSAHHVQPVRRVPGGRHHHHRVSAHFL